MKCVYDSAGASRVRTTTVVTITGAQIAALDCQDGRVAVSIDADLSLFATDSDTLRRLAAAATAGAEALDAYQMRHAQAPGA